MKNLLAFFFIALMIGCTAPAKKDMLTNPVVITTYNTPKGDKIVFLDGYYSSMLRDYRAGKTNLDSLYKADVATPILTQYFSKCEYADLVKEIDFTYPMSDTAGLKNYIISLQKNKKRIDSIVTLALDDANKYLKNDSITIYIQPSNNNLSYVIQKMGGITAVTAGSKQILITIDLSVFTWRDMLKYTIAHEFEHTYWTHMNFSKLNEFTLLDYLMFEGRADSYADLIYPDIKCPWTMTLSEQEKIDLWHRVKPDLQSKDETVQRGVMFGSNSYPLWGGYSLGFDMVQTTLRHHPELKPVDWANMAPAKILEMSNYQ